MTSRMLISLAPLALLLASCVEEPNPLEDCGETALAKSAWSCAGLETDFWHQEPPEAYSYTFRRNCFCLRERVGPFLVTVQRGVVTRVLRFDPAGDTVVVAAQLQTYSLVSLWDEAHAVLADSNAHEFVRYDSTWGFPESVYVDRIKMAADDQYGLVVKDFRRPD